MDNKKYEHNKESYYDGDDLYIAVHHNSCSVEKDLDEFVAEVCGEHDGDDWWWLMKTKDGKYALLTGGCDYTGWDCRSNLEIVGVYDTAELAIEASPEKEENSSGRKIREVLMKQFKGELPFALYTETDKS